VRVFYGWIMVAVAFAVILIAAGVRATTGPALGALLAAA
jgi:hypothetical protein